MRRSMTACMTAVTACMTASLCEPLHVPVEGLDVPEGAVQGGEDEGDGRHGHADP